ncbi:hypothetical protein JCGZ_25175 [Jatropha curcas]|uniref:Uncharacterized protein n=1 Tax=Jatropha curcas TaxID=180498 RepID=A0A067JXQ3_JATCU|nr:hypothetical protein JCGZ_25175 [Jatropha curcas]
MVISPPKLDRRNWREGDTRKVKKSRLKVSSPAVSTGNGENCRKIALHGVALLLTRFLLVSSSVSAKRDYRWLPPIVLFNLELWLAGFGGRGPEIGEEGGRRTLAGCVHRKRRELPENSFARCRATSNAIPSRFKLCFRKTRLQMASSHCALQFRAMARRLWWPEAGDRRRGREENVFT